MQDLNDSNVSAKAEEAALKVQAKKSTSVQVLEDLGPYLTDANLGKRKIGLCFLSEFLSALSSGDFLNPQECGLFAKFYQDRINDHHSLIPLIIKGMESIFSFSNLNPGDLLGLFRSFFGQVHTQSQVVNDRRGIFNILDFLLRRKLKHLRDLGSEFVLAWIQAVDAEKDPLNMNLIFNLWPIVLENFKLEPFEEDVFEAMSCYFPIDFSPPKGLETIVSKQDLVLGLRNCLATSAAFAPLALPLFMEKLDSDLNDAKIDANLTLIQCLKKYQPNQIQLHLNELWSALKKEILGIKMSINEEVISSCHAVITEVTLCLSNAVQSIENRQILTQWLEMIWSDIGRHLKDIELKFMSLTIDILSDIIGTGAPFPSSFMLDKAMPILFSVYKNHTNEPKKANLILVYMSKILQNSSDPGKSRPSWYETYLYLNLEALNCEDLQTSAALNLTSGVHFLQQVNAEQIFDSVIETHHWELIAKLVKHCQGSRPSQDQLERLYSAHKGQNLAAVYTHLPTFVMDLPRILSNIHDDFALDILKTALKCHANLEHDILKEVLEAFIKSKNDKKNELAVILAPKLSVDLAKMIPSSELSLIAHANADLINALDHEIIKEIMEKTDENEDLYHVQAAIVNKINVPDLSSVTIFKTRQVLWITKGLLFRQKPYLKSKCWIDKCLDKLREGQDDMDFALLTGSLEPYLSCPKSLQALARQKMFNLSRGPLIQAFQDQIHPSLHLKSLICQLPNVPKFALSSEMTSLLPLLNQGLENAEVQLQSLTCLKDLLEVNAANFIPFLSSFLNQWTSIACDKKNEVKVRVKALECIKAAAVKSEAIELVKMKKEVIKGLVPALDDHKRVVRQAASSARNQWAIL